MTDASTPSPRPMPRPTVSATSAQPPAPGRRVVDAPIRMFHALFAATFAGAYLTADSEHWRLLHVTLGYAFAGLLGFRLLYGLLGPRQAALGVLRRRIAGTRAWAETLRSTPARTAARQAGHLATGWAIVAMLALAAPLALSGYGTWVDWGGDALESVHEALGDAFVVVVAAHLSLLAGLSLLRRRNLALPMLTGRVREPGPDPVRNDRRWLAAALLASVTTFVAWHALTGPAPDGPARAREHHESSRSWTDPARDAADRRGPRHGPDDRRVRARVARGTRAARA